MIDKDVSAFLKLYYNPVCHELRLQSSLAHEHYKSQTYLFIICAGNELFFVALYLTKWIHTPLWHNPDLPFSFLIQPTWAELMAYSCFPICALKNYINLVQLWKASKILVGVDLAERAKAREEEAAKR